MTVQPDTSDAVVTDRAIVVLIPDADPDTDRFTIHADGTWTTVIAVPAPPAAGPVAAELVDAGVTRVELCGGLGPEAAGRVIAAIGGRVPVGAVSFGIDSVDGAVLFRDRIAEQTRMTAGFIYLHAGLDSIADRRVVDRSTLRTVFVPVPHEDEAVGVAVELVQAGAELIELYQGIGPATSSRVIEAVNGRAPVGAAR